MLTFVTETNSFANAMKINSWKDTSEEEMLKFFAVLMLFGITCPLKRKTGGPDPRRKCVWCKKMNINTVCKQCNVALCLNNDPDEESCHYLFHHAALTHHTPPH